MENLPPIVEKLIDFVAAFNALFAEVFALALAHWAALLWIIFWLFVARWPDLRDQLAKGAWPGVIAMYILISLTWGLCSEVTYSSTGLEGLFGSVIEKFILSLVWMGIAFGCGQLQDHWKLTPDPIDIAMPPAGPAPSGHGGGHH